MARKGNGRRAACQVTSVGQPHAGPGSGEGNTPIHASPADCVPNSRIASTTRARTDSSRTTPPRPTSRRPASNCGLISVTIPAPGESTCLTAGRIFVNEMNARDRRPRAVLEAFVLLLAPYAPHLAEELWSRLGHDRSLMYEPWPQADPR